MNSQHLVTTCICPFEIPNIFSKTSSNKWIAIQLSDVACDTPNLAERQQNETGSNISSSV